MFYLKHSRVAFSQEVTCNGSIWCKAEERSKKNPLGYKKTFFRIPHLKSPDCKILSLWNEKKTFRCRMKRRKKVFLSCNKNWLARMHKNLKFLRGDFSGSFGSRTKFACQRETKFHIVSSKDTWSSDERQWPMGFDRSEVWVLVKVWDAPMKTASSRLNRKSLWVLSQNHSRSLQEMHSFASSEPGQDTSTSTLSCITQEFHLSHCNDNKSSMKPTTKMLQD